MKMKLKGTIVVTKKNVVEVKDVGAGIHDGLDELLGKKVSIRLVSSVARDGMSWLQWLRTSLLFRTLVGNPDSEYGCVVGAAACLEHWLTTHTGLKSGETALQATFDWDDQLGEPVALLVRNQHHNEFFLKSVTLEDYFPAAYGTKVHFECNSWVYSAHRYKKDRVFFTNKPYLPHETPKALHRLREEELETLRGNGKGMLQVWDRVYDYAYYNDLGEPDKGPNYVRPTLGGSTDYPYPRRCRTGRQPTNTDPTCETRIPLLKSLDIYVPRDERFFSLKLADFAVFALKAVTQGLIPELEALAHFIPNEFESFQDVIKLYEGGIVLPNSQIIEKIRDAVPFELIKELLLNDGKTLLKFPMPAIIKENKDAWRTDEEFAREMLAGLNPLVIRLLEKFPPTSNLDPTMYGNQNSKITREDVEPSLQGLTIHEALRTNRLFILDYNDIVMPYLRRINKTSTKMYATRTILLLKDDGTLKPVVIELILPHPEGNVHGAVSKVIKPAPHEGAGVKGTLWQLAKAHVGINDSGYHQLISHWLHTHASMEPFVIATNRQLSVLHPIHKLLHPHYRDTMNVNALARQTLINAQGIFESTVFPGKYAFEMSSYLYRNWVFTDQALPNDLLKRGMAVKDQESPNGYRLLIEDYPYAVDGLEIWNAIQSWVKKYCVLYYKSDDMVLKDTELQQWWKEVREKAHGDKKDEPWWPKMKTVEELTETCTTIIWVASALHAAINFGQYPYGGFLLNRPTISRRFIPELGTRDYEEMETNPEKTFLKTVTGHPQTLLGIAAIEILSNHGADELYLGQRESPTWTSDVQALKAFKEFGEELKKIELNIMERNANEELKNRVGPAKFPYTLLYPSSGNGMTCKGIPNSVSI